MTKQNKKIHENWWFWVICAFVVLISISMMFSDESNCEDCSIYKNDLYECEQDIADIKDGWNDYLDSFEDYCELDPLNLLCGTIPER